MKEEYHQANVVQVCKPKKNEECEYKLMLRITASLVTSFHMLSSGLKQPTKTEPVIFSANNEEI